MRKGITSTNVNLMTTGISTFGEQMSTTMMHARNALKIKKHNQLTMEARIRKLNIEAAKTENRIKAAEKRAQFIDEMNHFKQEKIELKR